MMPQWGASDVRRRVCLLRQVALQVDAGARQRPAAAVFSYWKGTDAEAEFLQSVASAQGCCGHLEYGAAVDVYRILDAAVCD